MIYGYQQRTGSINFAATQTRPDVAKSSSLLAQHNHNPTAMHLKAADHCLRYLLESKKLGIQYGGEPEQTAEAYLSKTTLRDEFYGASDASYGDDHSTRKSSEGWMFFLFKGPIDWKATRQQTVTKSSTEAELLSLSHAGSEMIWWKRLFNQLRLQFDRTPVLYCDNLQTLRVIQKEAIKLNTKLRHVDIHQHWLRQAHQDGRLQFEWLETNDMPADGLTKLLPPQRHHEFVKQLNLVPVGR